MDIDPGLAKVVRRTLPVVEPPVPLGGGRIVTPAGELAQVVNGQNFQFLIYLEFVTDASRPRGNHYHNHRTEHLYVLTGHLRAVYLELDSGARQELALTAGDLVTVPPRYAHVYFALERSQAIEFAAQQYDPADVIPCNVE